MGPAPAVSRWPGIYYWPSSGRASCTHHSALSPYNNVLVGEIALHLIALAGLSLLTGTSGQISLGQGAVMAVGAYTVALLMTHTQMNFFLELLASIGPPPRWA